MRRLALLGLNHETNTFVPTASTLEDFLVAGVLRGAEIHRDHDEAHTAVAGLLALDDPQVEVVPLLYASLTPSGMVEDLAYDTLVGEALELLEHEGPWDGVLLALHGAMVTPALPDADGELLRRVRDVVGADMPIGCTLDMHANVSPLMVASADVLVGYLTNPHIDPRERGLRCARLIATAADGRIRPTSALTMVPAVISITRQSTDEEPMGSIMTAALGQLERPGVLDVSVFEGYPYADVTEMGMSVVVVTDADPVLADEVAAEVAAIVWAARRDFARPIATVTEAFDAVASCPDGPVVLLDVGDNVGGGGTGDSTVLLAEALDRDQDGVVTTLHDPAAVARCVDAGVGAEVTLAVGGHAPGSPAPPVTVTGRVRTLSDGRYEEPEATHGGTRFFDAGPTAVIITAQGQLVVCTTRRILPTSLRQLRSLGIEPLELRVLVAKGVVSPVAAYARIATRMLLVDTPGVTTADLGSLAYHRRRSPLHPFDDLEPPQRKGRP